MLLHIDIDIDTDNMSDLDRAVLAALGGVVPTTGESERPIKTSPPENVVSVTKPVPPALVQEEPEPETETAPETAPETKAADPVAEALEALGRKPTKQATLADGTVVKEGSEVVLTATGEVYVVDVTTRGFIIATDESGNVETFELDAVSASANEDEGGAEPETAAGDDLPDDHLLDDLRTVGGKVKAQYGVAKIVDLIRKVSPDSRKSSDVPPALRGKLLDLMTQAVADAA